MSLLASGGGPVVTVIRWVARLGALSLILCWGAFFVEHLSEWYSHPHKLPPPWVTGMMLLHLSLLVGLFIGWRWEVVGAVVSIAAGTVFFYLAIGLRPTFAVFTAITAVPGILWIICALLTHAHGGAAKPAVIAE